MSLLLEALRKAEKAKDDAKRQAEAREPADSGLTLAGDAPAAGDKHVVTRDELPDISQPLEILSEDITPSESGASSSAAASSIELVPEHAPRPAPKSTRTPAAAPAPEPQQAARAAAKNLFDAKFREPNPKLPFYIVMGALGVFAVGTVIYFWMQLRPPPPLVNPNPSRPPNEKTVEVASSAKPAAVPSEPQAATSAPQIPGLPGGVPQAAGPAIEPAKPAPAASAATATPVQARGAAAAVKPATKVPALGERAPRAASSGGSPARGARPAAAATRAAPMVHPRLEQGYAAYQSGNFAAAREAYIDALKDEPSSRDALLGMAAVEVRAGRFEAADGYYQRLLRVDPRDADAHAGTLALRGQLIDPVQAESRVKSLLSLNPDAHALNFSLGNQYAQQGRWPEAQQAYFRAHSSDPENPDYSYNLAVSLDQLRQPQPALEYYRRALALAQSRAASFDQVLARTRVQTLSQSVR